MTARLSPASGVLGLVVLHVHYLLHSNSDVIGSHHGFIHRHNAYDGSPVWKRSHAAGL